MAVATGYQVYTLLSPHWRGNIRVTTCLSLRNLLPYYIAWLEATVSQMGTNEHRGFWSKS